MLDVEQVHVVWEVIHCTEEEFVNVVSKAVWCFHLQMCVELRDRKIFFLRSIANSIRGVDHWILALVRLFISFSVQEREGCPWERNTRVRAVYGAADRME